MKTTKTYKSNAAQILVTQKKYKLTTKTSSLNKKAKPLTIRKTKKNLTKAFNLLAAMPEDFYQEERKNLPQKNRKNF